MPQNLLHSHLLLFCLPSIRLPVFTNLLTGSFSRLILGFGSCSPASCCLCSERLISQLLSAEQMTDRNQFYNIYSARCGQKKSALTLQASCQNTPLALIWLITSLSAQQLLFDAEISCCVLSISRQFMYFDVLSGLSSQLMLG